MIIVSIAQLIGLIIVIICMTLLILNLNFDKDTQERKQIIYICLIVELFGICLMLFA
jgi:NADH:ubiquinone oxidoreductase subunit 2 (subunit N)